MKYFCRFAHEGELDIHLLKSAAARHLLASRADCVNINLYVTVTDGKSIQKSSLRSLRLRHQIFYTGDHSQLVTFGFQIDVRKQSGFIGRPTIPTLVTGMWHNNGTVEEKAS